MKDRSLSEIARELGRRGGSKTSLKKKLATRQNVAKAREALRRKREALKREKIHRRALAPVKPIIVALTAALGPSLSTACSRHAGVSLHLYRPLPPEEFSSLKFGFDDEHESVSHQDVHTSRCAAAHLMSSGGPRRQASHWCRVYNFSGWIVTSITVRSVAIKGGTEEEARKAVLAGHGETFTFKPHGPIFPMTARHVEVNFHRVDTHDMRGAWTVAGAEGRPAD
jgi:hypothetical protein